MNNNRTIWTRSIALVLVLAFATLAPTGAESGESRTHDGFFLRVSGGGGYATTTQEFGSQELEYSGGSFDGNIAIGAVVAPNLAIHATAFGWFMSDPDAEGDSVSVVVEGELGMAGFGAGVTYYFMPVNIYVSPSVGLATVDGIDSDAGVAVDVTLGKEWWVGDSWGLGIALAGGYHSVGEKGTDANWSGGNFGVRFSATFN